MTRRSCARARLRVDELTADGAEQRLRDCRRPHRPQPAQVDGRAADERVVAEPAEKLGVVVVEREHPAELLRRGRGVGADRHRAVRRLPRVGDRARHTEL